MKECMGLKQRIENNLPRPKERKKTACLCTPHRGAGSGVGIFKTPVSRSCLCLSDAICARMTEALDHASLLMTGAMVPGVSALTGRLRQGREGVIFIRQNPRITELAGSIQI